MAFVRFFQSVDFRELDFNYFIANGIDLTNEQGASLDYFGETYDSQVKVISDDGSSTRSITLVGTALDLATFTGDVNLILERDEGANKNVWYASGLSLPNPDVAVAAFTATLDDDRAVIEAALAGNDRARLSSGKDVIFTYGGRDKVYAGAGNDVVNGGGGADELRGEDGKDKLSGSTGADLLVGGADNDTLNGGRGADTYQYEARTEGGDTIVKFDGQDHFAFVGSAFGNLAAGAIDPSIFVSGATNAAQDANDRFIYNTSDHTLWFDSNGSDAGGLRLIATIQSGVDVQTDDIIII